MAVLLRDGKKANKQSKTKQNHENQILTTFCHGIATLIPYPIIMLKHSQDVCLEGVKFGTLEKGFRKLRNATSSKLNPYKILP